MIFFLLGLNLPKSFSLLAFVLFFGLLSARAEWRSLCAARQLLVSIILIFSFGITFSVRQFQLGYWALSGHSIADMLTFTFFPATSLITGYLARRRVLTRKALSLAIMAFALGGLCYVLLALGISRNPWWDLAQVFRKVITVPWGEYGLSGQNVRSVEQRLFPALIALSCLPLLIVQRPRLWRTKVFFVSLMSLLASYALWALQGRLQFMALALSFVPYVFLIVNRSVRMALFVLVVLFVSSAPWNPLICDERYALHLEFLRHISSAPWGGRTISFVFEGCQSKYVFAAPPAIIHLPHNIFLDVTNDVGIVPALFLLLGCSLLLVALLRGFVACGQAGLWNSGVALRFGIVAVVIVQSLFQPFLYSDRSFFVLSFLFAGAFLSEFSLQQTSKASRPQ